MTDPADQHLAATRQRLRALQDSGVSLRSIARGSGLGLGWLHHFASGEIQDPGFRRLSRLEGYLDVLQSEGGSSS